MHRAVLVQPCAPALINVDVGHDAAISVSAEMTTASTERYA